MIADRIKDVWGPRTPHAPGEEWPARVDRYLQEGLAESDVQWHQSACVLCSNGLRSGHRASRTVASSVSEAAQVDRVNHGRLGPKGLFGWQANNSATGSPLPLVRRDGALQAGDVGRGDEAHRRAQPSSP